MAVLVPIPKNSGEVYGFLVEIVHVLNTAKDTIVVRIDDVEVKVIACAARTSDDYEGMDFILKAFVDDEEIEWIERFSSITISSVGDEIVLYPGLSRPVLGIQPA